MFKLGSPAVKLPRYLVYYRRLFVTYFLSSVLPPSTFGIGMLSSKSTIAKITMIVVVLIVEHDDRNAIFSGAVSEEF